MSDSLTTGLRQNEGWFKQRAASLKAWRLPKEPSSLAPPGVPSNKDQDPTTKEQRTWGGWTYAFYWMSDLINATTWQIASSSMAVGLSTKDAIAISVLAALLNCAPLVLAGAPGLDHHIPFPIAIRAAYGYWFSYFCVVSRGLLSAVWFGVNCYYGSFIITEIIAAIWPSYRHLPNYLPASTFITTQQMLSYAIFSIVQIPFLLIPVRKLKTLFMIKAILLIPVSFAMVIWICIKAGSVRDIFGQPATVSGPTRNWIWISALSATTNSWLSNILNMSDFTRFSRTKRAPYSQLPTLPIVRTVYAIFGIAMTGAGRVLYNEDIWSPIALLSKWTGAGGRACAFICGCLWLLAQLSTNISANTAPFGHDAMNIAPGWINVRRGSFICFLLGAWAMVPWLTVNSASKFISFMNGYGCFVCVMVSILLADYFLVRRSKLDVPSLYDPRGRYRYKAGVNWRAAVVQVAFGAICMPGLINAINPAIIVPSGFRRIYDLNWFINTFGALAAYWLLFKMFPAHESLTDGTISTVLEGSAFASSIVVHEIKIAADITIAKQ